MPLSQRARILSAKQAGPPAEDVLRFVHPEKYLPVSKSAYCADAPQAARDGLEFASILSGKFDILRPKASRKNRIRQVESGGPSSSGRAPGALGEVMKVADLIPPEDRSKVSMCRILTGRLQRGMLSLGWELRAKLLESLEVSERTPDELLQEPFEGTWPVDLPCKGLRLRDPEDTWRDSPGSPVRRKHVPLVLRGATQVARQLNVLDNSECKWLLRATHNSDEVRKPFEKRQSARSTARLLVRGSPTVETSVDLWPGRQTASRPAVAFPEGGPRAEPVGPQETCVPLESDLSVLARKVHSAVSAWAPPQYVAEASEGKRSELPLYPLCALGLSRGDLEVLFGI